MLSISFWNTHIGTYKKWSFPLRISSENVTKSAVNCGFCHIYRKNCLKENLDFCEVILHFISSEQGSHILSCQKQSCLLNENIVEKIIVTSTNLYLHTLILLNNFVCLKFRNFFLLIEGNYVMLEDQWFLRLSFILKF